jgi:hypothetical protein
MRREGEIAVATGRPAGSARVGDSGPAEDARRHGQTLVVEGRYTIYGAPAPVSVLPSITF